MDALQGLEIGSNDRLIVVLGLTGAGKSTFIGHVTEQSVDVGHSLVSCTAESKLFNFHWHDHERSRIWLLDTPGFDDTTRADKDVLQEIIAVLIPLLSRLPLAGFIYLHPITDVRMRGAAQRNLAMVRALVGPQAYRCIALTTSMWEQFPDRRTIHQQRHNELMSSEDWWRKMIEGGAQCEQHRGTRASAIDIISGLLTQYSNEGTVRLQIQKEIEDEGKELADTAAGMELEKELRKLRDKLNKEKQDIMNEMRKALQERDDEHAKMLSEERAKVEEQLAQAQKDQDDLRAHYDEIVRKRAEEHERIIHEMRQERDDANAKVLELEQEISRLNLLREEERQKFEKDKCVAEERIAALESRSRKSDAKRERSELQRQEAQHVAVQNRYRKKQQMLEEPHREAVRELAERTAAIDNRKNIVFMLNINLLGRFWKWGFNKTV